MNKYQLGFTLFFASVTMLAVLVFAGVVDLPGKKNNGNTGTGGSESVSITMWGTLDNSKMREVLKNFNSLHRNEFRINYVKKSEESIELDFLRAVSSNKVPDLILFPSDLLLTFEKHLKVIPETSINRRDFSELFVDGAEIFINEEGISALPILADPLVMYWNKDLFNNERITEVPKTWDDMLVKAKSLTKKDARQKILQSAVALGGSKNINHFKEILSMLLMQTGDKIIQRSGGRLVVYFGGNTGIGVSPSESAISFYTGFSNPKFSHYSWNASFSDSINEFISGRLAMYFGLSSDLDNIKKINPHLNFDVAPVPQLSNATKNITYGKFYSIGVPKLSPNYSNAFRALFLLAITENQNQETFSKIFSLPPVKRILLSKGVTDPLISVFYNETPISKTWLDPNPAETEKIFSDMIDSITSNSTSESIAIKNASVQLQNLIKEIQ